MQAALAISLIRYIRLYMVGFVLLVWLIVYINCESLWCFSITKTHGVHSRCVYWALLSFICIPSNNRLFCSWLYWALSNNILFCLQGTVIIRSCFIHMVVSVWFGPWEFLYFNFCHMSSLCHKRWLELKIWQSSCMNDMVGQHCMGWKQFHH